MAFKLEPGIEYLTHNDSEHDHVESADGYEDCRACECANVKETGPHCEHCYHCGPCSTAVAMGCRPCPSCFDRSIYPSYILRKRKGSDPYDMRGMEDDPEAREFYASMPSPGTPNYYEPDFELTGDEEHNEEHTNDASTHHEFDPTEDGDIAAYEYYETMDSPGSLNINPVTPPPGDEGEEEEAMVDHVEVAKTLEDTSATR
ncbi:hypothetical protein HBH56_057570 [Parastagonospora nodorum]|uniref:Uncharacterized protein n=1 Tax=Phaeosphaeria nodorum (strain SN15 / ATCC MYA-4574 / FGSC 10173) TaxID=321614 RepID=A0A7U2EV23_PHANO|nr:hypothetical protein HBH56_057570 [Parastagonospora nodorum]QRC91654.1 hypothetical protein JI435_018770 [Parastagonospora nodorum SN15]KAH3930845.1 hypothetical protein HBH54_101500 [Parastagonospora nodorum]KAH4081939.1 hypothetical protein HBH46_223020 [Parastagonospora nodorum]KAH4121416.1 hypothetical protein HBH47_098470 [Parastagonospora nodorum]